MGGRRCASAFRVKKRKEKRSSLFLLPLVLVLFFFWWSQASAVDETAIVKSASDAKKGVVRILATDDLNNPSSFGIGSGFCVGKAGEESNIIVTNRHVVFDEESDAVWNEVYVLLGDDAAKNVYTKRGAFSDDIGGRYNLVTDKRYLVRCKVLYPSTEKDPEYPDIAILEAERSIEGRVALVMKQADSVPDNTEVSAIGYPASADITYNFDPEKMEMKYQGDVSGSQIFSGKISTRGSIAFFGNTWALTHSAQIDHGNSGGPLVTDKGTVIGINTYLFTSGETSSVAYNMSLYIDYAMSKLDDFGLYYEVEEAETDAETENDTDAEKITDISSLYIWIAVAVVACASMTALILLGKRRRKEKESEVGVIGSSKGYTGNQNSADNWKNKSGGSKKDSGVADTEGGDRRGQCYRLRGVSGTYAGREFPVEGTIRIGRTREVNDLAYPENTAVSRTHCRLICRGGELFLEDLSSSNGTWINGRRLPPENPTRLREGAIFSLAGSTECFRVEQTEGRKPEPERLFLVCTGGYQDGRRFEIRQSIRIGRDPGCAIRYPDNYPGVSRRHVDLTVERRNGRVSLYLCDMSSTGTMLERTGNLLPKGERVSVWRGDVFYIGDRKNRFEIV